MSVYAFDSARRVVVASWPVAVGAVAHDVAPVGPNVSEQDAWRLCAALTGLSRAVWDVYARPASAADDEQERERREDQRQHFDVVVAVVR